MIKLEHVVLASPEQMEFIIEGCRNPYNSWNKSDSIGHAYSCSLCDAGECVGGKEYYIGENDHDLMQRLSNAGTDHRKFMRMMPVYVRITAPLYWWKEFDTYKVGTVANSCSTMHKIQEKEFTLEDFSCEHMNEDSKRLLLDTICMLNIYRVYYNGENTYEWYCENDPDQTYRNYSKKDIWWQMIQLLPSSYNQTRNVLLNYEVLANIYKSRKNHKLDEWKSLCSWIESLPYSELITGSTSPRDAETEVDPEFADVCDAIGNPNLVSTEDLKAIMKNL